MARKTERRRKRNQSAIDQGTPAPRRPNPRAAAAGKREWGWGALLFGAVFLAYSPAYFAGFFWDDAVMVSDNPFVAAPKGIWYLWTTRAADLCPLTLTTFWFEHLLWGNWALPYHVVTVLLHGAAAVVLWRVLLQLQVPGAWLGAALWALHPVQVESVAWIAEMKNTQSGLFFLLATFFFLKTTPENSKVAWSRNYGLFVLFAILAMASKSSTIILPAVLALAAWWKEGRWNWRTIATLWPAVIAAILPVLLTLWTQQPEKWDHIPAMGPPARLALAGDVAWFYLGKLVFPYPLMLIYPRWPVDASNPASYVPLLALGIVLALLWRFRKSGTRGPFFALACFIVTLLPVMGLVQGSYWKLGFVADHLQYLAGMGPLALAGAGLHALRSTWRHPASPWTLVPGGTVLVVAAGLTVTRCLLFQDPAALWGETLSWNPTSTAALTGFGEMYLKNARFDLAATTLEKSLELAPDNPVTLDSFGYAVMHLGNLDGAINEFEKALELRPDYFPAHVNLGLALFQKGQLDAAAQHFSRALELHPESAEAHNGIGIVLGQAGRLDEAAQQVRTAIALDSTNGEYFSNLGGIYLKAGRVSEAIPQLQHALALQPALSDAQQNLTLAETMLEKRGGRSP